MVIFNSFVKLPEGKSWVFSLTFTRWKMWTTQTGLGEELCFGKGEAVAFQGKAAGVEPATDPRFMAWVHKKEI